MSSRIRSVILMSAVLFPLVMARSWWVAPLGESLVSTFPFRWLPPCESHGAGSPRSVTRHPDPRPSFGSRPPYLPATIP
jgi:hypothetical protein